MDLIVFEFYTVHCLRFEHLSFLHSLEYIIFRICYLHTGRCHHYLHLRFFLEFFKTLNCIFQKDSKNMFQVARPLKRRTREVRCNSCFNLNCYRASYGTIQTCLGIKQ
jgi:hypothetical protein